MSIKQRVIAAMADDWNFKSKGTAVKLCRFGNWTGRASEFDEGFTFSKLRVLYYGLQTGLFTRESMEAVVAPAKPAEPCAEGSGRPDMQHCNAPLQRFRAAAKGNAQLAAVLMSDPACRMKAHVLRGGPADSGVVWASAPTLAFGRRAQGLVAATGRSALCRAFATHFQAVLGRRAA